MSQIDTGRRRSVWVVIGGSLLCLVLLFMLLDPLPILSDLIRTARLRRELPAARDRWEAGNLASYRVSIRGAIPLACLLDGELTVRDGRLAQVLMRENALVTDAPLRAVEPAKWINAGCSFEELTVEAMFERVENNLNRAALFGAPLSVEFDAATGYITEYRYGRAS
jgi:hypothetical protein